MTAVSRPATRGKMNCPECRQSGIALLVSERSEEDPLLDFLEDHGVPGAPGLCPGSGKSILELTR